MSENVVLAIVLNGMMWAFSAGAVYARLGALERSNKHDREESEREHAKVDEKFDAVQKTLGLHGDRLTKIETRCKDLGHTPSPYRGPQNG